MKNICLVFISALLIISFFSSCGPSVDEAIKYNDTLISLQDIIVEKDDAFLNSHDSTPQFIKECHTDLINHLNSSISTYEKIGDFYNYSDFKKACIQFLNDYKNVAEKEYVGMMEIVSKPDTLISTEEDSVYSALFDSSIDKIENAAIELTKVQEEFARKYKFNIAKKPLE